MTKQRASELRPEALAQLRCFLQTRHHQELFAYLGQVYLCALQGWAEIIPQSSHLQVAEGTPGKRLSDLFEWLYGESAVVRGVEWKSRQRSATCLRGIKISMTPEQALDCARQGIAEDNQGVRACHAWCVLVDGERVGVKWLVSRMAGVPVSTFHTHDAVRLLSDLGVEVRRG
jgi:hypothetical protein